MLHDTPGELAQPYGVSDWKRDGTDPMPGRTMPSVAVVERDYPNLYASFTSIGPLLKELGNGGKGIGWNTRPRSRIPGRAERHGARRRRRRAAQTRDRHRRHRGDPEPRARNQRRSRREGLGSARQDDRPRPRAPRARRRRTRRSASATSSRSRARSSRRRPGRASRATRSATTPATPTCTSSSPGAR